MAKIIIKDSEISSSATIHFSSSISGTIAEFTEVTASFLTGSTADFAQVNVSYVTGSTANFAQVSASFFTGDGSGITNVSRKLVNYINNGPAEEYNSAYLEVLPVDSLYPTASIWWTDETKTAKVYEENYQRTSPGTLINPNPLTYKLYAEDGTTVLIQATDTITYTAIGAGIISRSISSSFY